MSIDIAFNEDRHIAAIRSHSGDSWWVFPILNEVPKSEPYGHKSNLPGEGWTRLFPATERNLAAETLERIADEMESAVGSLAWLARHLGQTEDAPDA